MQQQQDCDNMYVDEQDEQDRRFDVVVAKHIYLDSVKSIIFTILESGTNQR